MIFNIEVNNKEIKARKGETILEALERNGISVPTLCHMQGYSPTGACRICVVEVEGKTALIPACSYPVEEWMKIKTHSPRVIKARRTIVEMLLSNHPDDCLYCERNGNCELQDLAIALNVRERRFAGKKPSYKKDLSSTGMVRDPSKCILCGRCVRVCDEEMMVSAIDFIRRGSRMVIGTRYNHGFNNKSCISCGQCVMVCPTGALYERSRIADLQEALHNPDIKTVVHVSPTISVSLAEEFGIRAGKDLNGLIASALRKIGFDRVFDTTFAVDLYIMEMATELSRRITDGVPGPMFSGCCPAWVQYAETFHPELLPRLTTTRSPQQLMGALVKNICPEVLDTTTDNIFNVSVMPCIAKKYEAQREEMTVNGTIHTDVVLTTRELASLIKLHGIDIQNIEPELADPPYNIRSSAGKLAGVSGGIAESLARTLYFIMAGRELPELRVTELRQNSTRKEVYITIGEQQIGIAAVSGMKEVVKLLEEIRTGRKDLHFVEVMACQGGCVNGGGQHIGANDRDVKARMKSLYEYDDKEPVRVAHKNASVHELFRKYLEYPVSDKAKNLLHTSFRNPEQLSGEKS